MSCTLDFGKKVCKTAETNVVSPCPSKVYLFIRQLDTGHFIVLDSDMTSHLSIE